VEFVGHPVKPNILNNRRQPTFDNKTEASSVRPSSAISGVKIGERIGERIGEKNVLPLRNSPPLEKSRTRIIKRIVLNLTLQTSDRNNAVGLFRNGECLFKTNHQDFIANHFALTEPGAAKAGAAATAAVQAMPGGSTLLLPMVQFCLKQVDLSVADLGLISVTRGPGMFTPLRVGVVAAKTMAFVNDIPLVGVDVLEALASAAAKRRQLPQGQIVEAVVNAQRKQIFVGRFEVTADQRAQKLGDSQLVSAQQWAEQISGTVVLTGPGLKIVPQPLRIELGARDGVIVEADADCNCDLESVADIAEHRLAKGDVDDPWSLAPIYFRPSAAEEVRTQADTS
jgi:tRNA threonylcarbamoyladenosine biosynthesis protein TsaB